MKYSSIIWVVATLVSFSACSKPTQQTVMELHASSVELGNQTSKLLEQLIQQRNSINVQGRTLTAAEIAFSDSVSALELPLAIWMADITKVNQLEKGKERLASEQSLHDAIHVLQKKAKALADKKVNPSDN